MLYSIALLGIISFFSAQAMQEIPQAPIAAAIQGAHGLKASDSIACSGMAYQYPTLDEVKNSPLGASISDGDLAAVRLAFDGPSGLKGWAHWLLTDEKRQWVRIVHSLLHAVELPEETTGSVVLYLWKKVKEGHLADGTSDNIAYDLFESKGTCLILNACQNGHEQLLAELIKRPDMQYGVCESLWHAVQTDNIALLRRLLSAGAQCEDNLLSKVFGASKKEAAAWLIKQKVGLHRCDQQTGSALHIAIQKKSSLVLLLINALSTREINCDIVYTSHETDSVKRVVHRTALDLIFDQEKPYEQIVEMLVKRGARCGLGASDEHHALLRKYREKLGLSTMRICLKDLKTGQEIECEPVRPLGL